MDRTWTYRNIHLIISLLLIRSSEIASKEYYCTKVDTWREAMTNCTRSGGVPLSYRDVYNSTEFTLKDSRNVWTADYIYLEYMTDIAQRKTAEDECGYKTFDYKKVGRNIYNYFTRYGTQYGPCTALKQYVCVSPRSKYPIRDEFLTWDDAFSDCSPDSSLALWGGFYFTWNKIVENLEIWDRRVRRVLQGTVNGTITIYDNYIDTCGTNVEEVKRYNNSNCEQHLESVCVFDDTVHDTDTFTKTCFEEDTTEVPANVTRRPFEGSTNVTSADNRTFKEPKEVLANVTRRPFGGSTHVTSADKRTSKAPKEEFTEVPVNVTRRLLWSSLIVTSAEIRTSKEHKVDTAGVPANVTRRPFGGSSNVTSADNRTSKEPKGQGGDSIAKVVATISVSLTICCILIGIGLFCYWKQRRNIDEKQTTVRYVNENLSTSTTGRNPSDTYGGVSHNTNAVDITDENYEALDASSGINSLEHVYTELNREYENVYTACRN